MKKLRLSTLILVVVAMLLASVVMVFAQDNDVADLSNSGGITPTGPGIPLVPEGTALHDNGPLVNSPGTGVGGDDESVLQTALGLSIYGFGIQTTAGNRIADDFTIGDSAGWDVTTITVYAYQSGAGIPSTLNSVDLQIWDGDPSDVASTVVWGDDTTNVMTATGWSGIYRVTEAESGTGTARAIMSATVNVDAYLPAGTYWIDYSVAGTGASGPWAPPVSINGQTGSGNAMQFTSTGWAAVLDGAFPQDMPFIVGGQIFAPTDVSFTGFSGNATSNNTPIIIGLLVLTVLAGAIVVRRQVVR